MIPALQADVIVAAHTECALKIAVLMPAFSSRMLNHRAIVKLKAGECLVVVRRGFDPISFQTDLVLCSYTLAGQNSLLWVKSRKKYSADNFVGLLPRGGIF